MGPLFTPIRNEQNIDWERDILDILEIPKQKANIRRDSYCVTLQPLVHHSLETPPYDPIVDETTTALPTRETYL